MSDTHYRPDENNPHSIPPDTIAPLWWETLWFRAILVVAVASLLYGGYRWQVWRVEQRNRQNASSQ